LLESTSSGEKSQGHPILRSSSRIFCMFCSLIRWVVYLNRRNSSTSPHMSLKIPEGS